MCLLHNMASAAVGHIQEIGLQREYENGVHICDEICRGKNAE